MTGIPLFQVDAFTNQAFAGNPAAVCILPEAKDENWMQNLAAEMNLSETAFLRAKEDGFELRWFTPVCEVALCGHATLASAHILWETEILKKGEVARFHTKSGLLSATKTAEWIELDFPADAGRPAEAPDGLAGALGAPLVSVQKHGMGYLVELESAATVRNLVPDFALLKKVSGNGIIVTSRSDSDEFDFVSRFFGPSVGINEDPVTGSAHCCLGPFWGARLNKIELIAYQASSRGGVVKVRLRGDRVVLQGQAVTVLRGELVLNP